MESIDIYNKIIEVIKNAVGAKAVEYNSVAPIVRPCFKLNMEETDQPFNEFMSTKVLSFRMIYFAKNKEHKEVENKIKQGQLAKVLLKPIEVTEGNGVWTNEIDWSRTETGELVCEFETEISFDEDYSIENNAEMLEELDIEINWKE